MAAECRRDREVPGFLQHGLLANDRPFDHLRRQCGREEEHRTGDESRNESYRGDGERPLHPSTQSASRCGMICLRWQDRLLCATWRSSDRPPIGLGRYHDAARLVDADLLGGLAEFEQHLVPSRTNKGRVRAKARGARFGRKPKLTRHQQAEALARIAQGETLTAIARSNSHMTISRLAGVTFMQQGRTNFARATKPPWC